MHKTVLICVLFLSCVHVFGQTDESITRIDVSGTWEFAVDEQNEGIIEKWYLRSLDDEIQLPGSMMSNNKGKAVGLETKWTASLFDSSFYFVDFYAPYREPNNFKVPFFLQPNTYYTGVAWYQREVDIPADWEGKWIGLHLERCHWETQVWVNGKEVGKQNYLGTPHRFDLTGFLTAGRNRVTIRVDNAIREIDPGENSHSISDHTQGNWNGIVGSMFLEAKPLVHCRYIEVNTDMNDRKLRSQLHLMNQAAEAKRVDLSGAILGVNKTAKVVLPPGESVIEWEMSLPPEVAYWDEFNPNLYEFMIAIGTENGELDRKAVTFGCRNLEVKNGAFRLNGNPLFLRGTLHCASFPLTGYPSTDKTEWLREFGICKAYGINHIRFHSWCPPRAAFEAADELGLYLQVECSTWPNQSTSIGDSNPIDAFLFHEAENIVKEFGNHPSFCFLALGNEPAGKNRREFLSDFVSFWKNKDARRLYVSAGGWPNLDVNDFISDSEPRIQHWEEGLNSLINASEPSTAYDWGDYTGSFKQPVVSHEIGQWCVYPNFREIKKYTGVYRARNFEIFQESLIKNGLIELADSFLLASGKLQTLCYKADIEAALRTPNFGGFQLLGLNDFSGQGTALVGPLDAFWEEKGYTSAAEYRRFNNSVVPLARMDRLIFSNQDAFSARIEAANYKEEVDNVDIEWRVKDALNRVIQQGGFVVDKLPVGNGFKVGEIGFDLATIVDPSHMRLEVTMLEFENSWDFWVFPENKKATVFNDILLVNSMDSEALKKLEKGGKVLLSLEKGSLAKEMGGDIAVGFSSIFWNTSWTNGQEPHTLGILCDPRHKAFSLFPTEYHSNYQWWDAMSRSGAIKISHLSEEIKPIVRVIDDWFTNRSLALLFEVKVGNGSVLVSGIDFHNDMDNRLASRQLLHSLLTYMNSSSFQPQVEVEVEKLMDLIK